MKILLIVPPDTMSIEASMSKTYGEKERGYYPKLGILYVAASVEQATGEAPFFIDCPADGIDYSQLAEKIEDIKPDLIGIGVLTFNLLDAVKTAKIAKEIHPLTKVCFGGTHAGLFPKETLQLEGVDLVVHGEGEIPFVALVSALESKASPEQLGRIPGVGAKNGSELFLNLAQGMVSDLDTLPLPARHLIDMSHYSHVLSKGHQFSTLQSSRGCPFACTFCDIRKSGFRYRSPENVIAEIAGLADQGVDDLFFVDDTITVRRDRVRMLCQLLIDSGIKVHYKISSRVDLITPDILELLKESGCYRIHYGVESGTLRLLQHIEKGVNVTPERVAETFQMTKKVGIQTLAYMMVGLPTETRVEMQQTVDFTCSLDADYAQFSVCTPYPKTELYSRLINDGTIPYDYWQEFVERPDADFRVKFWNPDFSEAELRDIQDKAHQKFYGRPTYLLKELMKVRSLSELNHKIRMGSKILLHLRGSEERVEPPDIYVNTGS